MRLLTARYLTTLCAAFATFASSVLFGAEPSKTALPVVAPEEVQMDAATLNRIDALVEEAIADGQTPGAVVAIGRGNKLAFLRAYGDRQTEPTVEKATADTLYDLASVTKVSSTAIGIAILVERYRAGCVRANRWRTCLPPDWAHGARFAHHHRHLKHAE
ncbi:MAG: serine hydrolase [Thermoguttaceae bacterium]|nr:serine hydrolase [Thermoguttaceae bacterium]